jgi:hypothetical protein
MSNPSPVIGRLGNALLLTESLEVIQKTSAVILSALELNTAPPSSESSLAEAS